MVGDEIFSYTGKTSTTFTGCANVDGTPLTTMASGTHTVTQHAFVVDLQGGSSSGDNARLRDWWMDYEMVLFTSTTLIRSLNGTQSKCLTFTVKDMC